MSITTQMKRDCALREVRMRERVYRRWVADGRMTKENAEREIEIMRAIADDYAEPDLFGNDD